MSFKDLASQCRGRWSDIVVRLAPSEAMQSAIDRGPRRFGYCPVHGGVHGDAFRVFADFEDTGGAVCNSCGQFSNGFKLLAWLQGWSFGEVARQIEIVLSNGAIEVPIVRRRELQTEQSRPSRGVTAERLLQLWNEAHDFKDERARPVRLYLENRGIDVAGPMLRCHAALPYFDENRKRVGEFPAMLAQLLDPTGELVALHRTYLTQDGAKAPIAQPKKLMKRTDAVLTGAAIRLYPPTGCIGVTEGIENALAVRSATGMQVWAATSWPLLAGLELPSTVRSIVIWADRDMPRRQRDGSILEPGREAANRLAARLRGEGRSVSVRMPPPRSDDAKIDWNDVLKVQGTSGFPVVVDRLPSAFGMR